MSLTSARQSGGGEGDSPVKIYNRCEERRERSFLPVASNSQTELFE